MTKMKVEFSMKGQLPDVKQAWGSILAMTAMAARQEWARVARQKLHTTASNYINCISQPEMKRTSAIIRLRADLPGGQLANMQEQGSPPFDMKIGMLKGRRVKRDKRGRPYTTVPLGLKVPGGGNRGTIPPVMPWQIYRMASQLKMGQTLVLPKKYEGYGLRSRLSPDLQKWGAYTWKSSPFQAITKLRRFGAGDPMSRYVATGAKRTSVRTGYATFRRVSKASDPNSWIHPGFRPANCAEQASKNLERIFPQIVNEVFGK